MHKVRRGSRGELPFRVRISARAAPAGHTTVIGTPPSRALHTRSAVPPSESLDSPSHTPRSVEQALLGGAHLPLAIVRGGEDHFDGSIHVRRDLGEDPVGARGQQVTPTSGRHRPRTAICHPPAGWDQWFATT